MHSIDRRSIVHSTVVAALAMCASTGAISAPPMVVMTGLDNPRGMAFAPNGALYVAEAGRGGAGPCAVSSAGENRCYGLTGAITRLWKGTQERVAEGLPSHAVYNHPNPAANPDGSSAGGPNDISFQGSAYITMGLGGGVEFEAALAEDLFGALLHMPANGKPKAIADVAAYEFEHNPAGGPIDSNPFGVLAEAGRRLVADAGANALLSVSANGTVEKLAVFPPLPNPLFPGLGGPTVEAVPTSVARGPDGVLYVGQLTGFPFVPNLANIYRVVPGQDPVVHCSGFKTIIDLTFGPDGSLYVVENATGGPFFPPNSGRLSRVAPDCSRTVVLGGLDRPTSVAVGPDGAIYVTNHGVIAGAGEVLKISP